MPPLPTNRLSKALVLAQLAIVAGDDNPATAPPDEFVSGPPGQPGDFVEPNFKPERNYESWGNQPTAVHSGFFTDTATKVVRLWADWNAIQLYGPGYFHERSLQALDSNIAAAKALQGGGLTVILTTRGFPGHVSGYGATSSAQGGKFLTVPDAGFVDPVNPFTNSAPNMVTYFGQFPVGPERDAALVAATTARDDQGHQNGTGAGGNSRATLQLRLPGAVTPDNKNRARTDLLGTGQHWNTWIRFLACRYHPDPAKRAIQVIPGAPAPVAGAVIDVLEIVNEPNFECWPQISADVGAAGTKAKIAVTMTARMLSEAASIEAEVNSATAAPLYFAGPATSDSWAKGGKADRFVTSYDRFLKSMAALLGASFDPGERFVFTHHNYRDIEEHGKRGTAYANLRAKPATTSRFGLATANTNSASWVSRYILGKQIKVRSGGRSVYFRWRGWPAATAPCLALTEGGARLQPEKRGGTRRNPEINRANQGTHLARTFNATREGDYGDNIVLFSNFLTYRAPGPAPTDPETRSWLVDRVIESRTPPVDVGMPGISEPTAAEYEALKRPAYRTWKSLSET